MDTKQCDVIIKITASVSASVTLEEGETLEDLKQRDVDIYLHGFGVNSSLDKIDMGAEDVTIEILNGDDEFDANAVCGQCGNTFHDVTGMCSKCEGDYWVQFEDFDNPELDNYISVACDNLKMTKEELLLLVFKNK